MWLMTTIGFFSIVEKPWDREHQTVTVRARDVDYDNFKNAVEARQGHTRSAIYERVWIDLLALQRGAGDRHG